MRYKGNIQQLFLGGTIGFFALWPLMTTVKRMYFNCYNAIDFSIYQQAIYDILALKDPNPFVSVRGIEIFNDHFDPIIYLAVVFTAIFGQGFQQLLVFEWLFFASLLLSIIFLFKGNIVEAFPYLLCVLTSRLLFSALFWPIHPTTWSVLPFFWLVVFIVNHNARALGLTVLALCLFRESYPITLFPLGIFYILRREYRLGLGIVMVTLPFIAFEFHFREELLGKTIGYSDKVLNTFMQNPISHFKEKIVNWDVTYLLKCFLPWSLIFFVYAKNSKGRRGRFSHQHFFAISTFLIPLLLLQVWKGHIDYHYGAPFAGILLGVLVISRMFAGLSKKIVAFVVGCFLFSSWGVYTDMFETIYHSRNAWCYITPNKIKRNQAVKGRLTSIPKNEAILATGGIIPFIMLPAKSIDHYKGFSLKRDRYHYLVLERSGLGNINIWWAEEKDVEDVLKRCRPKAREIYIDDQALFFARGDFVDCVYPSWAAGTPGWYFPP